MRSLGIAELETTGGHVRRLVLGPPVDGDVPELAEPAAPVETGDPAADTEAREVARRKKIEDRTFAAGRRR